MASMYDNTPLPAMTGTRGTPRNIGAGPFTAQLRLALRAQAANLALSGWADNHPIDADDLSLEVIEQVSRLGQAELHVLSMVASMLVRITAKNGFHHL